jgi:hypothetical protein
MSGTITWSDGETAAAPGEMTPVTPNPGIPVNPNPGTGGTFTITGIPSEYNGKYAYLFGDVTIIGLQSFNMSSRILTLSPISNGSVSIPLWADIFSDNPVRYSGNDTLNVEVNISNSQTLTNFESSTIFGFSSVTFSNGSATKSWSEGHPLGQPQPE